MSDTKYSPLPIAIQKKEKSYLYLGLLGRYGRFVIAMAIIIWYPVNGPISHPEHIPATGAGTLVKHLMTCTEKLQGLLRVEVAVYSVHFLPAWPIDCTTGHPTH